MQSLNTPSRPLWTAVWIGAVPFLVAFAAIGIMAFNDRQPLQSAKANAKPEYSVQTNQQNSDQGQRNN